MNVTIEKGKKVSGQYLSFGLNKQSYGVPISSVIEINQMAEITTIPEAPPHVKGVLNLRGKIIPVVDLRLKFGLPASPYTRESCIIVIEAYGQRIGMIVDSVQEVLHFEEAQVEITPQLGDTPSQNYISGIGKLNEMVVILLDIEKAFSKTEFSVVSKKSEEANAA